MGRMSSIQIQYQITSAALRKLQRKEHGKSTKAARHAAEQAAHTAAAKRAHLAINNSTASKSQEQKLKRQLAAAVSRGATGKHLDQKSSLLMKAQWRAARLGDKGRSTKSSKGFSGSDQ